MADENFNILIVDDNPENIRVLGAALKQSKYNISVAFNGKAALERVKASPPHLILLDVMMPEMTGFQVCEILKNDPETKDIEIIFVTAAVSPDEELKGLALGAVDYLHKPFSIPIIQSKVALHLERMNSKKELQLKNAALAELSRLRDEIEHITRHDLKTPLTAIMGYAQLMLVDDELPSVTRHKYLDAILNASNEMLHMINNSLDIYKMETGLYLYQPESVEMTFVIEQVIKDLRMLTRASKVKIEIQAENLAEKGFQVLAEKTLTYSLFANLIRNAVEACNFEGTITVAMHYEDNQGVISITNPGSVPESIRDRFFDKYSTAGKSYGTGLGTYYAKLMTETQHGTIAMTTDSKETCITVRLPAH